MHDYNPKDYPLSLYPPTVYVLGEYPVGTRVTFQLRRFMPVHHGYLRYLIRETFSLGDPWSLNRKRYFVALFIIEPRLRNIMTLNEAEINLLYQPIGRLIRHYQRQDYNPIYDISKGEYIFSNN